MSYYCNKCGWLGETSEHENCDYFACDVNWKEKALQHDLDIANARIKELEGVNLALIAERDKHRDGRLAALERTVLIETELASIRSELDGLKNQDPFVFLRMLDGEPDWSEDCFSTDRESLMDYSDSEPPMELFIKPMPMQLFIKPMPTAIPEWMALVPVEPSDKMIKAASEIEIRIVDENEIIELSNEEITAIYKAMIAASQTGCA